MRHGGFESGSVMLAGGRPVRAISAASEVLVRTSWRASSPRLGKPSRGTPPSWAARARGVIVCQDVDRALS